MFVKHQMIVPDSIERRVYQQTIYKSCMERSTLVVLPTGIGKTVIALMAIAETLRTRKGKILFLATTKPLVEQHSRFLKKHLKTVEEPIVITGEIGPAKRKKLWPEHQIIVATPQVISNDLISGQMDLNDVSLIIFDEAHRAVGDYAYVFIAEKYRKVKDGRAIGLTASPGSQKEKILEVCDNLGIEGVEIRHDYDPDVVRYIHNVKIRWLEVGITPGMRNILEFLKDARQEQVEKLQKWGYLKKQKYVSIKDILAANREIQTALNKGTKSATVFQAASIIAVVMKLNHASELAETQGLAALRIYFDKLVQEARTRGATKASKTTIGLPKIQLAMKESKELAIHEVENPKIMKVIDIVKKQLRSHSKSKIIVFTHFRDTSEMVREELAKIDGIRPERFVGQASRGEDKGLRQKQQVELIERFKNGDFNVLVATSVAEEGLDIPSTDVVIFYEPVPSEIRTIQRRGRTGRQTSGKVFILITKGTRDEAYYWSSRHKESRMHRELESLRKELTGTLVVGGPDAKDFESADKKPPRRTIKEIIDEERRETPTKPQMKLGDFLENSDENEMENEDEPIAIIVDTREFNSSVVRELARNDIIVESKQLDIADYVISDRVAVERKEVRDYLASLKDGRLFPQMKALRRAYTNPLMIIEGDGLFERSGIGRSALYGSLASITVDFGVPIITVKDESETAGFLMALARRERSEGRIPALRADKGIMLLQESQQFMIEGLPNVSAVIAQRLLAHFGSASAVLTADVKELMKVKGVGKVIAEGIREVLDSKYYSKGKK